MGVPVILTPQSQVDLREIVSFIAHDNPDQAVRFGDPLIDKALSLGTFPERGRMVPELRLESVREIIHGSPPSQSAVTQLRLCEPSQSSTDSCHCNRKNLVDERKRFTVLDSLS
jgi:plasmid stabilization system protein ParE